MPKKVLIFYNSIGLGHKSIAENIGYYLSQAGFEVQLGDILQVQAGSLSKIGAWLYDWILEYVPWLWHWLYTSRTFTRLGLPFRTKVAASYTGHVLKLIEDFQPDAVITTHTNATAILSVLKTSGQFSGRFGIAFSDFHLHPFWIYKEADFYLVNIPEQKQQMVNQGISSEKIFICGMTLQPQAEIDRESVRIKLGVSPGEKVVLLAGGSLGWGIDKDLVRRLNRTPGVRTIVICGKNKKLFEQLKGEFPSGQVLVFGYYRPLEELYAISDLFITKPGGLSVSEALRRGLPMLISHLMPGPEELNYDYLLNHKLVIPKTDNIMMAVEHELHTGQFRGQLGRNEALKQLFPDPQLLIDSVRSVL